MLWKFRCFSKNMATLGNLQRYKEATRLVYGPVDDLSEEAARAWTPPDNPGAGGHRGRYLWTDAFGVVNFITLSKETKSPVYLTLAKRLASTVHDVLGTTRDGTARLHRATDLEPLGGGLRIGKIDEHGSDGDGQYHHYLTLWMFALNRLSLATGEKEYNQLAVQLAKAIHPHFVIRKEGHEPRMCTCRLKDISMRQLGVLSVEIADYRLLMNREGKLRSSSDPLDLGMGLWMCHFFRDEDWARFLGSQSLEVARIILDDKHGLPARDFSRRLSFREFGVCLGLQCFGIDEELTARVAAVIDFWQSYINDSAEEDLRPISLVMYAAALVPGAFRDGCCLASSWKLRPTVPTLMMDPMLV
ncbi:hypothetical protein B0H63DRAFT_514862 [Podospora didyma]|uniref:Uncharacterized protein n=1 Tax=Podospora didyma TaxID=330526 RepID=A0AAE0N280_9PEZI|nr:hypothetical protein B0H63DRAFT_514862 [Podospora didyma]